MVYKLCVGLNGAHLSFNGDTTEHQVQADQAGIKVIHLIAAPICSQKRRFMITGDDGSAWPHRDNRCGGPRYIAYE
jgi:hypothetical protein